MASELHGELWSEHACIGIELMLACFLWTSRLALQVYD